MPHFTSTTFTKLVRAIGAGARNAAVVNTSLAQKAQRIGQTIERVIAESFPSTTTPAHLLNLRPTLKYARQPIQLGTRNHRPLSTYSRARITVTQTFRSKYNIPPSARNGGIVGNVGLGTARIYSTGPAYSTFTGGGSSAAANGKIPMGLRAIYELLTDEDNDNYLPKPSRVKRYNPYSRKSRSTPSNRQRSHSTCSSRFSISSMGEQYTYYFHHKPSANLINTPFTVESLITPGTVTTLTLPLSPSFLDLLHATPEVPYLATEIGVKILSELMPGVLALEEAYSLHWGHKIYPLLTRLDQLGMLNEPESSVEAIAEFDISGNPDFLKLEFKNRSLKDVLVLLRGCLEVDQEGVQWWGVKEGIMMEDEEKGSLNKRERKEMMEIWDDLPSLSSLPHPAPPRPVLLSDSLMSYQQDMINSEDEGERVSVQLIIPTLDTSLINTTYDNSINSTWTDNWPYSSWSDTSSSFSTSSNASSIVEAGSNASDASTTSSSFDAQSLTSSLLALSDISNISGRWVIQPSPEDVDIESAIEASSGRSSIWDTESDRGSTGGSSVIIGGLLQPW